MRIWIDVLDIVEFCSLSISIQIQLKEIKLFNGRLNRKRKNHCVNKFRPVALSMQMNCPGYFGNSPDPSLNNTILMGSTNTTEGNCLVVGV